MLTTIRISSEIHTKLSKIKGALQAQNGHERSFDEVLQVLIEHYNRTKPLS